MGISKSTGRRWLKTFSVHTHRQKYVKLSTILHFVEKVSGGFGLYLNPPENTVLLCVDKKTQDPGPGPHQAGAAMDVATDAVIAKCEQAQASR
jgi:hypothetical protein